MSHNHEGQLHLARPLMRSSGAAITAACAGPDVCVKLLYSDTNSPSSSEVDICLHVTVQLRPLPPYAQHVRAEPPRRQITLSRSGKRFIQHTAALNRRILLPPDGCLCEAGCMCGVGWGRDWCVCARWGVWRMGLCESCVYGGRITV